MIKASGHYEPNLFLTIFGGENNNLVPNQEDASVNFSAFVYPLSILYFFPCHVIPFAYFGKGKTRDDVY